MRREVVVSLLVMCFIGSDVVQEGEGIWLNVPPSKNKCVSEEIQNNVVVLADYVVVYDDPAHVTPTISVKVWFPLLPLSLYFFNFYSFACIVVDHSGFRFLRLHACFVSVWFLRKLGRLIFEFQFSQLLCSLNKGKINISGITHILA